VVPVRSTILQHNGRQVFLALFITSLNVLQITFFLEELWVTQCITGTVLSATYDSGKILLLLVHMLVSASELFSVTAEASEQRTRLLHVLTVAADRESCQPFSATLSSGLLSVFLMHCWMK
jgi:hypothetical protein